MIKFEKPKYEIEEYVESNNFGRFVITPLERGFGTTIGNSLRRVMLSSLPGTAIVSVKIEGVLHEFQKIEGVVEDVTTMILSLKDIVFKNHTEERKVLTLTSKKVGPLTAGDITPNPDIEIINPDLVICNIEKGGSINMEITVDNGRGYVEASLNKKKNEDAAIDVISVDSSYSPIEFVKYEVEDTRVGQDEDYDKLTLEVKTNGAMRPEEAMALSSQILIEHFKIISDLNEISNVSEMMLEKEEDSIIKVLEMPIEEIEDLSARAYNCLKRANINTVENLVSKTLEEISEIRNLGKKSLEEVISKVENLGLSFKE